MLYINVVQLTFYKADLRSSYFIVRLKRWNIFIELNQCLLGKLLTLVASKYKKWRKCEYSSENIHSIVYCYKTGIFFYVLNRKHIHKKMKLALSFSQIFFMK